VVYLCDDILVLNQDNQQNIEQLWSQGICPKLTQSQPSFALLAGHYCQSKI
jgi:hypothetical protein